MKITDINVKYFPQLCVKYSMLLKSDVIIDVRPLLIFILMYLNDKKTINLP